MSRLTFRVCDTLTGRIVGRLYPTEFELPDPWTGAGAGTITIPLPPIDDRAVLVDLTRQRDRWVAVEDEQGRFLWGGPIVARPGRSEGTVRIPVADWRTWFYRAPIRPNVDGTRRDYIVLQREQATIAAELVALALDTPGAPGMVVDSLAATGVLRDRECLMLDRSIGEHLDGLSARKTDGGIEWWVYIARDTTDPLRLVPHVAFAHPERQTRTTPVRLEWQVGKGGNLSEVTWPEGTEEPTRVWALGEGEPPDQPWAVDEDLDVADGAAVAWEATLGPLDGVRTSQTCFTYATAAIDWYAGQAGQFECTVTDESIPVGDYGTGDRARLIYDDGWDAVDLAAVRITGRTLNGGRGKALSVRLTLDLANDGYGDTSTEPGEAV